MSGWPTSRAFRIAARSNMSSRGSIRRPEPCWCAAFCPIPTVILLPGFFVRMRLPMGKVDRNALLVPAARAADRSGWDAICLSWAITMSCSSAMSNSGRRWADCRWSPRACSRRTGSSSAICGGRRQGLRWCRSRPQSRPSPGRRVRGPAMISKFFIEHPVLANVLAIVLVLIGAHQHIPPTGRAISERRAAHRIGDARAIPAPAPRPSSTPLPCRSSCRSTACRA